MPPSSLRFGQTSRLFFMAEEKRPNRAIAMTANAIDVESTPPTQKELATWIRELECPPEILAEAGQRLEEMWDESPGPLRVTGWVLGGLHGWFDAEPTPGEFHAAADVCVDVAGPTKEAQPPGAPGSGLARQPTIVGLTAPGQHPDRR